MTTRNRTLLYRKYRDALKSVRVPAGSSPSSSSSGGPVIELATTLLLHQNRSYVPVSTEDPGTSRYISLSSGAWLDSNYKVKKVLFYGDSENGRDDFVIVYTLLIYFFNFQELDFLIRGSGGRMELCWHSWRSLDCLKT
ncbi:unnamed protein product [Ilex paraguariensis]|uniref:Uncharacterized protein n=1 Tax=Ilex paraguariensis TaxID=185542 RepID=A0ABC8UY82_9AQUA